ncbi:MAG: hypothetical protein ALECFALPRED_005707 [Alectoria fallacina]|uniref:Uncharacterized protein n=1 Tax=Alectoria fallacina TaxID=1903189 RepID=A0A8H3ESF8_9LECA|nr:MAG: hypothetical protein ALECFALPRED_005707 [Alectoria fallacina]
MLRRVSITVGNLEKSTAPFRLRIRPSRPVSTDSTDSKTTTSENTVTNKDHLAGAEEMSKKNKTQAELDDELRQKLEAMSGDGGAAGLELEDGQPVSMKRSVKNNMFRYI